MPYTASEIRKSPAHKYLTQLVNSSFSIPKHELSEKALTREMKKKWEGNYEVKEYFDSIGIKFSFKLVFSDPQEELVFRLRYE